MTKTIKRLLPAALAVLLAGCAMQPVDSTTTRYRVALVAKNNRDSEFWDAVFTGAEAAATEYNLQLTITAPDDEEDYAAQNQLIADAVEDGAQAIVFSAIDYEATPRRKKAGPPVPVAHFQKTMTAQSKCEPGTIRESSVGSDGKHCCGGKWPKRFISFPLKSCASQDAAASLSTAAF